MIRILLLSLLVFFSASAFAVSIAGNPKGKITLVEFMDYECPHCRHMAPVIDELIQENHNLRVIYRVIPAFGAPSIFTDSALLAAAQQPQKRFEVFNALLLAQTNDPTPDQVVALAKKAKLNLPKLMHDMHNPSIRKTLVTNLSDFEALHNNHIPLIIIGRSGAKAASFMSIGEQPISKLQTAINHMESSHD